MNEISFLRDYPEAENTFKFYADRVQKFSSWIKMRYKKNHSKVEMSKIFSDKELKKITFYLKKWYEYADKTNSEEYAPIEFGDSNILSGEYQWSTESDFIGKIEDGYLPLIKDGTSSTNAYERAKRTVATGTSTKKVILAIFHRKNNVHEDHFYHSVFKDLGYLFPNDRKDNDKTSIYGGSEWVLAVDPFTKADILYNEDSEKVGRNVYYPSTPQSRVRNFIEKIENFVSENIKDVTLKLAIFIKCRGGKTPAFIDLIVNSSIDYAIFIARRRHVAYEVYKNISEFFNNKIFAQGFNTFYENPITPQLKMILTSTVQSFEDSQNDFEDELNDFRKKLEEIAPYLENLVGAIVFDEAQIGGATEKAKKLVQLMEEILNIKIFIDLSGTPSKLYALKDYDEIVESDLQEENEIREKEMKDCPVKFDTNIW